MQRGHVLLDRSDFSQVVWVFLDDTGLCGCDPATFVALHGSQGCEDDLVGALTPSGPDLEK